MMPRMDTETHDPADLTALRELFADRPGAVPPIGWAAVRVFEAEQGIVLPEPYRTFVAEVCDGLPDGPPHYGLLPLTQTPSDWGAGRPERLLAEPFPLTTTWIWEDDEEVASEEAYEARVGPVFNHGSLLLGTDGCGMYWHLVVTGPQRGHVWLVTESGALPFGDATADHPLPGAPGFAGWAAHWAGGGEWFTDQ
ncbi:SMI1/KNR4 family protein [Kitasatospora sp. NPDC096147]|uniref:SMI1/KNR4 family protein n=1 Tax=Kitasatospora sp. NPDC096147 TaxID=3364093 RepID=UPI0038067A90